MLNKKLFYPILLTILLCISIDISSNYIALGKEDDSNDNVREKEKEEADEVPFILPFKAVPFP